MTLEQIKEKLQTPEYDFLKSNPHLGKRTIMLTIGGSHAYGTNIETSDLDIRGCTLQSKPELIGLEHFEQVIDNATDTTIYAFNKFVALLMNCNPNVIELLGNKPEHYLYLNDIGKALLENRRMFISQKAIGTFCGYANQQLRRLKNAVARDRLTPEQKEQHVLETIRISMDKLEDTSELIRDGRVKVNIPNAGGKVSCTVNIENYPLREFSKTINSLANIVSSFDKLSDEHSKKDFAHLNKHAMHLIRLYCICIDLLEKGDIFTYRDAEHDLLIGIRSGYYQNADGSYRSEFFEMADAYEKRLQYAKENTILPAKPNYKRIQEFVMQVNEQSLTA